MLRTQCSRVCHTATEKGSRADQSSGRGQGLNHALDDVEKLVALLLKVKTGEKPLDEALQAYEDEVVARGSKAALGSLDDAEANTKVQFATNPLAQRGVQAA